LVFIKVKLEFGKDKVINRHDEHAVLLKWKIKEVGKQHNTCLTKEKFCLVMMNYDNKAHTHIDRHIHSLCVYIYIYMYIYTYILYVYI
jgi:hypothetical protein